MGWPVRSAARLGVRGHVTLDKTSVDGRGTYPPSVAAVTQDTSNLIITVSFVFGTGDPGCGWAGEGLSFTYGSLRLGWIIPGQGEGGPHPIAPHTPHFTGGETE